MARKRIYYKHDRLRQLRAFRLAYRLGSISKAAASLGVDPPSVSAQVRALESELDIVLFDRSGSGVVLTRAGKRLLEYIEPLVQGVDDLPVMLMKPYEDTEQGCIQCASGGLGATYVLPRYVRQFRDSYPNVCLKVNSRTQRESLNLLKSAKVEFAVGAEIPHLEKTLQYHPMFLFRIVLIASLDHPLAARKSITPEEVGDWAVIKPVAGTYSRQFGEAIARKYEVTFKSEIEVDGWEAIKRYVACGLGVSAIPDIGIRETDRLSVIPLDAYFPVQSFGVFTRRDRGWSPLTLQFLRLMISDFPDSPPPLAANRRSENVDPDGVPTEEDSIVSDERRRNLAVLVDMLVASHHLAGGIEALKQGFPEIIGPFYSSTGTVYHVHSDCNWIPHETNRRYGTGGKRLCSNCAVLFRRMKSLHRGGPS